MNYIKRLWNKSIEKSLEIWLKFKKFKFMIFGETIKKYLSYKYRCVVFKESQQEKVKNEKRYLVSLLISNGVINTKILPGPRELQLLFSTMFPPPIERCCKTPPILSYFLFHFTERVFLRVLRCSLACYTFPWENLCSFENQLLVSRLRLVALCWDYPRGKWEIFALRKYKSRPSVARPHLSGGLLSVNQLNGIGAVVLKEHLQSKTNVVHLFPLFIGNLVWKSLSIFWIYVSFHILPCGEKKKTKTKN